ncbi:MAG: type II secretion system F family protein [Lachnospiraceae bacterium]|nr:type II secretion system F family protein [Lachnospiraceae bacterium]
MNKNETKMLKEHELSAFCMEVSMLLRAGMSLEQGILTIAEDEKTIEGKELFMAIFNAMSEGSAFNQALVKTEAFPTYLTDMVLMGEKTGNLEKILEELHIFYEKKEELYSTIKTAVLYPCIMVIMMFIVLLVLVVKILPIFSQVYYDLGSDIPASTVAVMKAGRILSFVAMVVFGAAAFTVAAALIYKKLNKGKTLFDFEKIFMAKSKTGVIISKARFAAVLSMAFSSGLELEYAMNLADCFITNPLIREKVKRCKEDVSIGESLLSAIEKAGIFEGVNAGILSIGLKSGNAETALKNISEKYSNESEDRVSEMVSSIEPVLVIALSVMVGLILLMVMMPLLGIMSALG